MKFRMKHIGEQLGPLGRKVGGRCEEGEDVEVQEEAGIHILAREPDRRRDGQKTIVLEGEASVHE